MAVQAEIQGARSITSQGPKLTRMELVREFRKMVPLEEAAAQMADSQIALRGRIYGEARAMVSNARKMLSSVMGTGAKFKIDEAPEMLRESIKQIATAAWKLECMDLDRAARINRIMGNFCAEIGDHGYAAGFFSDAAREKAAAAKSLAEHPSGLGDSNGERREIRLRQAFELYGKAIWHRRQHYREASGPLKRMEDYDAHWALNKAIAEDAVGLFREACRISYHSQKGNDLEQRARGMQRSVKEMFDAAFDVTTCFTGLRHEVLAIHSLPWQAFRERPQGCKSC